VLKILTPRSPSPKTAEFAVFGEGEAAAEGQKKVSTYATVVYPDNFQSCTYVLSKYD